MPNVSAKGASSFNRNVQLNAYALPMVTNEKEDQDGGARGDTAKHRSCAPREMAALLLDRFPDGLLVGPGRALLQRAEHILDRAHSFYMCSSLRESTIPQYLDGCAHLWTRFEKDFL